MPEEEKSTYRYTHRKRTSTRPQNGISARSSENKVTVGRFCKLDYGEEERARAKQRSRQRDLSRGSAGWTLETHPQTFANCPTRKEISKREISYEREREIELES